MPRLSQNTKVPCKGDCGRLTYRQSVTGLCMSCLAAKKGKKREGSASAKKESKNASQAREWRLSRPGRPCQDCDATADHGVPGTNAVKVEHESGCPAATAKAAR